VTHRDTEIVSKIRSQLVERLGPERFELWFGSNIDVSYESGKLKIRTDSTFRLERLRKGLWGDIQAVASAVLGDESAVVFSIDSQVRDATPKPSTTATHHREIAGPRLFDSRRRPGRRFASLNSFVTGRSNELAANSAQIVLQCPGEVTPLLIHGPPGVGKTHLLEGIWSETRQMGGRRVVYLSAEQFTTYFLQALRGGGLPSFRNKYRAVDLLIIDDLQFFAGKQATINEVLQTMDALLRESRQMVLTADRGPAELQNLCPELATRISGGLVCSIDPIDFDTAKKILRQLAARRQFSLSESVAERIAERVPGDARQLSGVLNRLWATREVTRRPITSEFADCVIDELFPEAHTLVRLDDIQRAVCDEFDIEPAMLRSDSRSRQVSHPRMLAMWLARKHTRAALTEISEFFGRRSHSTVVSAQSKVDHWVDQGEQLRCAHRECKVKDVLARLERNIKAS
jgi:chromosomal replication initiator protein